MDEQEKKVRRADQAKQLINHPLMQEAIDGMRKACFHNIETSAHNQSDQREDLYYMLRCISAFERKLKTFIDEGKAVVTDINIRKLIR